MSDYAGAPNVIPMRKDQNATATRQDQQQQPKPVDMKTAIANGPPVQKQVDSAHLW